MHRLMNTIHLLLDDVIIPDEASVSISGDVEVNASCPHVCLLLFICSGSLVMIARLDQSILLLLKTRHYITIS